MIRNPLGPWIDGASRVACIWSVSWCQALLLPVLLLPLVYLHCKNTGMKRFSANCGSKYVIERGMALLPMHCNCCKVGKKA